MNAKLAAQTIRDTVTMEQILGLYGYEHRRGSMCCPFHGDKNPSLKLYGGTKGWHCFGCGRGGSVIDFVKEHEGCDFKTAVIAINKALNLGLDDNDTDPFENDRQIRIQRALDDFVDAVYDICDAKLADVKEEMAMNTQRMMMLEDLRYDGKIQQITADDWTFLLEWKDIEDYNEYRIEKISEFKEVVAAWRRKHRKAL